MPQNDFVTFAGMRGCLMGVALTCSAGVLSPASADTPTSNPAQLEDVIVTAQRRSESLQEVPISLTAITGDKLESLGITTFADVAAMIPNLALGTGNGSGGAGSGFGVSSTRSIAIRGVSGDNTTGLYLNDTPIPTSLDPRLLDVERVEVLRGPQGTLFGAGSMGGVVRFVTREPNGQMSGKIDAEGYDVDHGGGGYSVHGSLNTPLIPDNVALRVSAFSAFEPGLYTRDWGGPQDPRSPSLPFPPGGVVPGQKDHVGAEQDTGFMASLAITPTAVPGLSITPLFIYQHSNTNGYPLADYTADNFVQTRPLNVPEEVQDTWNFGGLTIKQNTDFGRFIVLGSYFYRNAFDLEDGSDANAIEWFGLPYYVPAPIVDNLYTKTWTGEARFESNLKGPVQFVVGVFSSLDERLYHQVINAPGFDAAAGGIYGTDQEFLQNTPNADRQRAAYVDATYKITNAFQISAGIRVARLEHQGTYIASGPLNGGTSDSYSDHAETDRAPRFTAKYDIAPDQMVYASAAKGFRIGGTNAYVPPTCDAAIDQLGISNGHEFKSDSLWSYEVGTKNSLFDGRVKSRLAVYRIDWKNMQRVVILPCYWSIVSNTGAATSTGTEFELDAIPIDHLSLNLSGGYEDAKISEASQESNTVVGQALQDVPKWTGSATAQYTVPLSGERSAFLMGQYTYMGSRVSYNNVSTGYPLPSYSLANARLGVTQGPWEVALFARNLFDKLAATGDLLPETAQLPGRPRLFVTTPRTIGIQVRRDFGAAH